MSCSKIICNKGSRVLVKGLENRKNSYIYYLLTHFRIATNYVRQHTYILYSNSNEYR